MLPIHVVDAFTDRPFAGNPAGVCLLPAGDRPDEVWMQRVAAELCHSETAFALPLPSGAEADWAIRWFTPKVEATLRGHAALATAHILRTTRGLRGAVRFRSRLHGTLVAHLDDTGGITLDFPAAPGTEVPAPPGLSTALGTEPEATHRTRSVGDLLIVLSDEATVRALAPDMAALATLTVREGLRAVTVTAAADGTGGSYDFVSRFFAPANGIPEDPVTGSAHTGLAPYWSDRLGRDRLVGLRFRADGPGPHRGVRGPRPSDRGRGHGVPGRARVKTTIG